MRQLLTACGAALAGSVLFLTAWAAAAEMRSGERVDVTGTFDQAIFASGEDVRLAATSTDDAFAAGRTVRVEGATLDHVFLAGQQISVRDSTVRDVLAAGREVTLQSGQVGDDLIAAGQQVTLAPQASVNGDAILAGGVIDVGAPIGGQVRIAGGKIRLSGAIAGDVFLDGRDIEIAPTAHIQGTLTHRGRHVNIAQGARIDRRTIALTPRPEPSMRPLAGLALWAAVMLLCGLFLLAIVVAVAFPRLMNDASDALRGKPLSMLAIGVVIAILAPIAIVVLAITLVGLPLAFLVGAALAVLWPLSIIGAVYAAAMIARGRARKDAAAPSAGERALWAGGAMVLFVLIGMIPFLGPIAWWIAFLFGLGAVAAQARNAFARPAGA